MVINAENLGHREINDRIRGDASRDTTVENCLGQRFLGAGTSDRKITVGGIPGNALGAYLNGAEITVDGNAQDAVGDTMNGGKIVIHGSVGDAVGYAMRGGEIYIRGNAGYRAGIHMKEYKEKVPVMVVGGSAGNFLGEYQAGGIIVVLGLGIGDAPIIGDFPCTGMHGGRLFFRAPAERVALPEKVRAATASEDDLAAIRPYLAEYCRLFGVDLETVCAAPFTMVTPDSKNPYKQLYVAN